MAAAIKPAPTLPTTTRRDGLLSDESGMVLAWVEQYVRQSRVDAIVPKRVSARLRFAPAAATPREITDARMRPEIERLVEEIKQSVGLLRRHL